MSLENIFPFFDKIFLHEDIFLNNVQNHYGLLVYQAQENPHLL